MKKSQLLVLVMILSLFINPMSYCAGIDRDQWKLSWSELPELPAAEGKDYQPGLAGAFSGVSNGALLVAGGANFPDKPFWEGGKKVWHDDIYVLVQDGNGQYRWLDKQFKLPHELAYGVSVTTEEGILCIGGCDSEQFYSEVFLMSWDSVSHQIEFRQLPSLPEPVAFITGDIVGGKVYIAGGKLQTGGPATNTFMRFALAEWFSNNSDNEKATTDKVQTPGIDAQSGGVDSKSHIDSEVKWEKLGTWPGPGRISALSAGQNNGRSDQFYLFSGRNVVPGEKTELLTDGYRYDPGTRQWYQLCDIIIEGKPRCIMAAPCIASGVNHIIVFGGDDGELFIQLEDMARQALEIFDPQLKSRLEAGRVEYLENHPGFSKDILAFHTVTETWVSAGQIQETAKVSANVVRWGKGFIIPSGEVSPGIRTAEVSRADEPIVSRFGVLNYSILIGYLAVLVGMGIYFSRREKSTHDFFLAGRRIPWWAAGLSIFGTQLSAITFMAIPAKSYATDWRHFLWNLGILTCSPVVIFVFLPFYRRLDVTTAYEYLEKRFNLAARLVSSVMFMLFQLGRLAIVLFLPSIALSVVTGIDVKICIVLMGLLSIIYTVLGGIEAVIWTDVLQVFVLLGGAILCIVMIPLSIDGGFAEIIRIGSEAGKFKTFDFTPSFYRDSFWVIIIGGFFGSLISYGSDQTVIQRYLTTKDEGAARRGIWTNVIMSMFATLLFFGMGAALYAFYKTHPTQLNPAISNGDAIFPFYIVTQLPSGISGMLIAGVFAASMSSLDSSMNSVATAVTTDFYKRFQTTPDEIKSLRFARWITAIVGIIGTIVALMMAQWGIKSLWDQYNTIIGFFAGGLLGIFLLGMFTKKANGPGAVTGLVLSGVVQYFVRYRTDIHFMFYTCTGVVSCMLLGYIASVLMPRGRRVLEGLTVYSMIKSREK